METLFLEVPKSEVEALENILLETSIVYQLGEAGTKSGAGSELVQMLLSGAVGTGLGEVVHFVRARKSSPTQRVVVLERSDDGLLHEVSIETVERELE